MQPIYLSYPRSDAAFAHRLVADLQTAGYVVFVDAVGEPGTVAWANETRRAIRASGAVIMILAPAEGRRVGTRHEGVLALRGRKPFFVLRRSAGALPRYAQRATVLDARGDYSALLRELVAALPPADVLLSAPSPVTRPQPRPPRLPNRRRRRIVQVLLVLGALLLCAALGIVLGGVPV